MTNTSVCLTAFRQGLGALSLPEQRLIFNSLPDVYQAALWQDRLLEGASEAEDAGQKALFLDLREHVNHKCYASEAHNKAVLAHIEELTPKIAELFPNFTVFNRFTQRLTDEACPEEVVAQPAGATPFCSCASANSGQLRSNDCGALMECKPGGCTPTMFGCGLLWLQSCTGLCTGKFA
jgi:hypothetical protein